MICGITGIFFDAWNIALLKCHIHLISLDSVWFISESLSFPRGKHMIG